MHIKINVWHVIKFELKAGKGGKVCLRERERERERREEEEKESEKERANKRVHIKERKGEEGKKIPKWKMERTGKRRWRMNKA